jgi:hypothetical protein
MTISLEEHVARAIAVAYADFGNSASQMARAAIAAVREWDVSERAVAEVARVTCLPLDEMRAALATDSIRESERAACEAICQSVMQNWRASFKEGASGVAARNQASGAEQCLNAIAARKGKGDGK